LGRPRPDEGRDASKNDRALKVGKEEFRREGVMPSKRQTSSTCRGKKEGGLTQGIQRYKQTRRE